MPETKSRKVHPMAKTLNKLLEPLVTGTKQAVPPVRGRQLMDFQQSEFRRGVAFAFDVHELQSKLGKSADKKK
jgi:hypothetical protein